MTFGSVAWGVGRAFVGMALMVAFSLLASLYLLPRPFAWVSRAPQALLIWSLGWCFLFVGLADLLELSREIGAFLAGLSLAQLGCSHDLRRRVHPLMSFFIAVFFVTLGAQMQFDAALEHWQAAMGMSLFVPIGNPFIFMAIIARFRSSERTSFYTSVTSSIILESLALGFHRRAKARRVWYFTDGAGFTVFGIRGRTGLPLRGLSPANPENRKPGPQRPRPPATRMLYCDPGRRFAALPLRFALS